MTYWPQPFQAAYHQVTVGQYGAASFLSTIGSASVPVSTAYSATANRVKAIAFRLARPMTVRLAYWMNGATVSGNVILGVYDQTGIKLAETASTAQATINVIQSASIGPILLQPGAYYLATIFSDTVGTIFRTGSLTVEECRSLSLHRQTEGGFALPATLTINGNSGSNDIMVVGLSTQTVI